MENSKQKEKSEKPKSVTQFDTKLNKYGFLHIKKEARQNLPFKAESPLTARIEGNTVILEASK